MNKFCKAFLLFVFIGIFNSKQVYAYSVLTHEALIDASWDQYFVPLLRDRFGLKTMEQFREAHAYAYGGAVMPDMGYYPFGSKLFTNLVHYVRSGDFVMALMKEAKDANEFAFALGALCHYYADTYGHSIGVNVSVPVVYPKVKDKYGNVVTYEENPTAHKRVEFAFDVTQTAKGNYATEAYHDFIGFKVAERVLDRAFFDTYTLHLNDVFKKFSRAVSTFRWAVKDFFPAITKAAWASKRKEIKKMNSGVTARKFRYHMNRVNYNKEFGRDRDRPGFFSFVFSSFIRILPKIGPLAALKFKPPGPVAEKNYIASFDTVSHHIQQSLQILHSNKVFLANKDFDTGKPTQPGEYGLSDETYVDLIIKLKEKNFDSVTTSLKNNICTFFDKSNGILKKEKESDKPKVDAAIQELKAFHPIAKT